MERRNFKLILIIVICAVIFLFIKIAPLFETDTEKIRRIIYSARAVTEKEELFKCISYVSVDYKDKDGNDRPSLFLIGKNVFGNYDDIFIIIEDLKIDIANKKQPVAHLVVSGQGKRQTGEHLTDTQRVKFDIVFRREGTGFKVIELKFIEPEDFLQILKLL